MNINTLFPSNYLKAADLAGQARRMIIEQCAAEEISDQEHKPVLRFRGEARGLILNRTNAIAITEAYGEETNDWIGKPVELFPTRVPFQGRMVDALRVRIPQQQAPAPDDFDDAPAEPKPEMVRAFDSIMAALSDAPAEEMDALREQIKDQLQGDLYARAVGAWKVRRRELAEASA